MIYVDNRASAGFEALKELISTFPDYRNSFIQFGDYTSIYAQSLLFDAFYNHNVSLALYLLGIGREEHPFFIFFFAAFEGAYNDDDPHELSEKIQILDAFNTGYNFTEKFKSDYKMLKECGYIDPDNRCVSHKQTIKNLIIFNQYVQMRGLSAHTLFGEVEYNRLKKIIPDLTEAGEF